MGAKACPYYAVCSGYRCFQRVFADFLVRNDLLHLHERLIGCSVNRTVTKPMPDVLNVAIGIGHCGVEESDVEIDRRYGKQRFAVDRILEYFDCRIYLRERSSDPRTPWIER